MADDTQASPRDGLSDKGFSSFLAATKLPTAEDVEKKETALLDQHKKDRQPFLDTSAGLVKQMTDLNDHIAKMPTPKLPDLQKLPDAPDTKYQDPMQALGSLGSVLAMFGSLRTRTPLTAALNAGAASMEAFHKGDKERAEAERLKWQDDFQKGLRQNQEEMQQYTHALEAAKFDINKAQSAFRGIAAQNEHNQMLAAIEAGDFKAQMDILDSGYKAGTKAAEMYVKDQEFRLKQQELRERAGQAAQVHADAREAAADRFRENMDFKREQAREKAGAKAKQAEDKVQGMTGLIDQAVNMIEADPKIVGGIGKLSRGAEYLKNVTGISDETPAADFMGVITQLKNEYKKSPYGGAATKFKADAAQVDNVVQGLGSFTSPQAAISSLKGLKNHLQGLAYKDVAEGGGPAPANPDGATKTIGDKQYVKRNGQWYELDTSQ